MENLGLVTLFGILLRWCVSLFPYSGSGKPPMFGDYEAQRHWQEITVNLPIAEWYVNSTSNDLLYWGLDYPPLSAYHSYLCGLVAERVNPEFVELYTSRGYEGYMHKLFMRYTVFFIDLLIYIPAAMVFLEALRASRATRTTGFLSYIALLTYPGIILVDYGHFQYNNASLGFLIASLAALAKGQDCRGSFYFCLALNYKQMELYHALPIFFYLLGLCVNQDTIYDFVTKISKISLTVVLTFIIIWAPFVSDMSIFLQVINRLFPLNRGLFEDKVASVWCSFSFIFKFKSLVNNTNMALICLVTTVVSIIPSSIHLFIHPSSKTLRYALVNSSLIFFLLSFHVHEKNILLATIPACLIFPDDVFMVTWFLIMSVFSMFPLMVKDGLTVPTLALTLLFYIICTHSAQMFKPTKKKKTNLKIYNDVEIQFFAFVISLIGLIVLAFLFLTIPPPDSLPDLYPVLISVYSCAHFCIFCFYFHYRQLTLHGDLGAHSSKVKGQ